MNAQALPQATVIRRSLAPALYELAYSDKQKAVFVASAGGREKDAPQSRILRLDPTTPVSYTHLTLPTTPYV